jgi:hypothetical protein
MRERLFVAQNLAFLDQRIDPLLGVALGQLHRRRYCHHRSRGLVYDVADPTIAALGAADLRPFIRATRCTGEDAERQSMISRRYGVRSVRQRPGSDDARWESTR